MAVKNGPRRRQVNVYFDFGRGGDYQTAVMSEPTPTLAALRREIDRLDEAMHDLLMLRARAVQGVAKAKAQSGEPVLRPAREAEVLRRLVARHTGAFPKTALVRLWREIMAGHVHIQTKFSFAVYAPSGQGELVRLAHDQFGAATPSKRYDTASGVLSAVSDGQANVGILPMPGEEEADPWWPTLAGTERTTPRIVARLPFAPFDARTGEAALAIALIEQEPSGNDHSYVLMETAGNLSRHAMTEALEAAGLPPAFLCNRSNGRGQIHLVEVADFVPPDDARLARLSPVAHHAVVVGGYAVPFTAAEMGL